MHNVLFLKAKARQSTEKETEAYLQFRAAIEGSMTLETQK